MAAADDDASTPVPWDVRLLHLILGSLGVEEYSTQVPLQLLTFIHRYVYQILQDAQAYAEHSRGGNAHIGVDDVRLAVASKISQSFKGPPPKEFLLELAAERNRRPLPPVSRAYGVRLPPERYCLTQPNWSSVVPSESKNEAADDVSMAES